MSTAVGDQPESSIDASLRRRNERDEICEYFDLVYGPDGECHVEAWVKGISVLRFVLLNKGSAFTVEERRRLEIDGLLPTRVSTIEEQIERAYAQFSAQDTAIAKYQFLRGLQERQEILFHALVQAHLEEMLPIVYTPTVGEAVENYSSLYQSPRGLTVNDDNIGRLDEILNAYPLWDVRVMVVTDSSAILGIGDQGYGGLAISIGKLSLYTDGGGVSPFHTMPVGLDVGTDHDTHRDDPLYLGAKRARAKGDEYNAFVDAFVKAVHRRWPECIIQWEDLAKDAAFEVLDRYRNEIASINDDIQGTGAVTLAGVITACRHKGEKLSDQTFLVYGAGAGGIGVASAIRDGLMREGLSEDEARARIYVLDSGGLLLSHRKLANYKRRFEVDPSVVEGWTFEGDAPNLLETIEQAGVTVLLGLSGQPRTFTQEVVEAVHRNAKRPVIFPLSNPTKLCEATPADVLAWTDGQAFVATGSPFDPVEHKGHVIPIGQGNNAFVFPGIGLGASLARVTTISDDMVLAAAYALADHMVANHGDSELLFPPLKGLQAISREVATAVIKQAAAEGVTREPVLDGRDIAAWVKARSWRPEYLPIVRTTKEAFLEARKKA